MIEEFIPKEKEQTDYWDSIRPKLADDDPVLKNYAMIVILGRTCPLNPNNLLESSYEMKEQAYEEGLKYAIEATKLEGREYSVTRYIAFGVLHNAVKQSSIEGELYDQALERVIDIYSNRKARRELRKTSKETKGSIIEKYYQYEPFEITW